MSRFMKVVNILLCYVQSECWDNFHRILVSGNSTFNVSVVNNFRELVRQTENVCNDVILLDWEMPGKSPQVHIDFVVRTCPNSKLIVLTTDPRLEYLARQTDVNVFSLTRENIGDLMSIVRNEVILSVG
jgi:chemotaxis response regulator CheB